MGQCARDRKRTKTSPNARRKCMNNWNKTETRHVVCLYNHKRTRVYTYQGTNTMCGCVMEYVAVTQLAQLPPNHQRAANMNMPSARTLSSPLVINHCVRESRVRSFVMMFFSRGRPQAQVVGWRRRLCGFSECGRWVDWLVVWIWNYRYRFHNHFYMHIWIMCCHCGWGTHANRTMVWLLVFVYIYGFTSSPFALFAQHYRSVARKWLEIRPITSLVIVFISAHARRRHIIINHIDGAELTCACTRLNYASLMETRRTRTNRNNDRIACWLRRVRALIMLEWTHDLLGTGARNKQT